MTTATRPHDAAAASAAASRELGQRIRALRATYGLTQEELALLAGVSVRFVGDLERGKSTVRLSGVLAVCYVLGLTLVPS